MRRSTHLDYVTLVMAGRGECQVAQEGQFIPLWRWHFYGIGASNITIVRPIADCAREIKISTQIYLYMCMYIGYIRAALMLPQHTYLNNAWAHRCRRRSHCVRHSICPAAHRCCHCFRCPCTRTPRHDRRGTDSNSGPAGAAMAAAKADYASPCDVHWASVRGKQGRKEINSRTSVDNTFNIILYYFHNYQYQWHYHCLESSIIINFVLLFKFDLAQYTIISLFS